MKHNFNYRTLGIILIILSSLGLLFSIAGIALSWIIKPDLQQGISTISKSIEDTLINTDEGLIVLDSALDNVNNNLEIIITTFDNLDSTINGISSSLDSSATLIGDDLRQTLIDTQVALSSAATSAELIDKTLSVIAAIPFLGAKYQPDVPLHTSLETVAGSMEDIPKSLDTMEVSLSETSDGLDLLNTNLSTLTSDISAFESDLAEAQEVLVEYRRIITDTEQQINDFNQNLPRNLTLFMIFLSGVLFSLALAQCITLFQGIAYIEGEKRVVNLADITRE
jgi:methyl-accepting chemotaxis protein